MAHPKNRQERRDRNNHVVNKRIQFLYNIMMYELGDIYFYKIGTFVKHHPFSHHRKPWWKMLPTKKEVLREYYRKDYPEYF